MLLLLAAALAAAPPVAAVDVGGGATWLVGGNGGAYTVGPTQRASVEIGLGGRHGLALTVEHAHHRLTDAGAYWPDLAVPPTNAVGGRDALALELGPRLAIDVVDEAALPPHRLRVYPYTRFGVGLVATDTRLEVASFDGRTPLRSRSVLPAVGLGLGAEVWARRWLALLPQVRTQAAVARDPGEVDGKDAYGVEVRVVPSLDIRFALGAAG